MKIVIKTSSAKANSRKQFWLGVLGEIVSGIVLIFVGWIVAKILE